MCAVFFDITFLLTLYVPDQPTDKAPDMPPELLRRFEIAFKPLSKTKATPMRKIGAEHVGKLVSVKVNMADEAVFATNATLTAVAPMQGICTHVTDVKPHIIVATYTDAETGYEVYQHVTGMRSCGMLLYPRML